MNQEEKIALSEKKNTGTSWTRNESFDKLGYLPVENIWDPEELYCPLPDERGQFNYYGKDVDKVTFFGVEEQVPGCLSRYWHPQYRQIHSGIRLKLEKLIGRKLYNTYYYDRFYFSGQELEKHTDRDSCEISVSVHVSTNLTGKDAEWPFWFKTPEGEEHWLILEPGDGVLYKGCERPHWREPMPKPRRRKRDILLRRPEKEYYYHQIFFHYVLADGQRVHHAGDSVGY